MASSALEPYTGEKKLLYPDFPQPVFSRRNKQQTPPKPQRKIAQQVAVNVKPRVVGRPRSAHKKPRRDVLVAPIFKRVKAGIHDDQHTQP